MVLVLVVILTHHHIVLVVLIMGLVAPIVILVELGAVGVQKVFQNLAGLKQAPLLYIRQMK